MRPHPRKFKQFKQKPAEPVVCHLIESNESDKSKEEESSDELHKEEDSDESKDLVEKIPDLHLNSRGTFIGPLSSSSSTNSFVLDILNTILQHPNPLILQPTVWLPKEIFTALNKSTSLVSPAHDFFRLHPTKANDFHSMQISHASQIPNLSRGSSFDLILPYSGTLSRLRVHMLDFYSCTFTWSIL